MGKSVLLFDDSSASSGLAQSAHQPNSQNTILNMDLIQKQELQKKLIINEDVSDKLTF
jgi:hypothetical protein